MGGLPSHLFFPSCCHFESCFVHNIFLLLLDRVIALKTLLAIGGWNEVSAKYSQVFKFDSL